MFAKQTKFPEISVDVSNLHVGDSLRIQDLPSERGNTKTMMTSQLWWFMPRKLRASR